MGKNMVVYKQTIVVSRQIMNDRNNTCGIIRDNKMDAIGAHASDNINNNINIFDKINYLFPDKIKKKTSNKKETIIPTSAKRKHGDAVRK